MKLSIITINLNNKQGLQKTIESVVCQSFDNYELIVIDGQSTDGSIEIIKKYENKIRYWISEQDSGVYQAMNKGIRQSEGEYCYFLNSGDSLANPNVLSRLLDADSHESFICGNFLVDNKGEHTIQKPYKSRDWMFSLYDIYSGDLCHQAFLIKKDIFDKYGFYDENMRISSDWRLFFIAIGIHHETVLYRDVDMVIYNMDGLSSQIGGKAIYAERKLTAADVLTKPVAEKLDRLYYLEQNSYITDIIRSHPWLFAIFRAYCKVSRFFRFHTNRSPK